MNNEIEKINNKIKNKKNDVGSHQLFKLIIRVIRLEIPYMKKRWRSIPNKFNIKWWIITIITVIIFIIIIHYYHYNHYYYKYYYNYYNTITITVIITTITIKNINTITTTILIIINIIS